MNPLKLKPTLVLIGSLLLAAPILVSCDHDDPVEDAGETVEEAAEEVADEIDDATTD